MDKLYNYINGEFVSAVSGKHIDNVNPTTQGINNLIPGIVHTLTQCTNSKLVTPTDSDYRDVERAINAAKEAYKTWGKLHFSERCEYLDKIVATMKEEKVFQALAMADTNDMVNVSLSAYKLYPL